MASTTSAFSASARARPSCAVPSSTIRAVSCGPSAPSCAVTLLSRRYSFSTFLEERPSALAHRRTSAAHCTGALSALAAAASFFLAGCLAELARFIEHRGCSASVPSW